MILKSATKLLNQADRHHRHDETRERSDWHADAPGNRYSYERNDRGLAIMESLMPKLNELVASAAKLEGYDTRYLRDGEWSMTAEGELGRLLTGLAQTCRPLCVV